MYKVQEWAMTVLLLTSCSPGAVLRSPHHKYATTMWIFAGSLGAGTSRCPATKAALLPAARQGTPVGWRKAQTLVE